MKNFDTMPLRLRVWDKDQGCFILENADLDEYASLWAGAGVGGLNEVVSQDTGLKDKNGESIYTGDIIKVYDKGHKNKLYGTFLVQYDIENGELVLCSGLDMDSAKLGGAPLWAKYVVVGNIWENPELLKGGHDD